MKLPEKIETTQLLANGFRGKFKLLSPEAHKINEIIDYLQERYETPLSKPIDKDSMETQFEDTATEHKHE